MLAQWDLERPMVVAHDMGGAATLRAHLLHGCNFERYVLMNVVAMRPWGSAFFDHVGRSEEHTSELQSLMRISYAVFCLKKKKIQNHQYTYKNCNQQSN